MIIQYSLQDKKIRTLLIPKGTVLFKELKLNNRHTYESIFHDFIGSPADGRYCISPKINNVFYTSLNLINYACQTNIIGIYITQYNFELIIIDSDEEFEKLDLDDIILKNSRIKGYIRRNKINNHTTSDFFIHPLHFRQNEDFIIGPKFYSPETIIKYCIENRAQYNFFPLFYITNDGIISFDKLADTITILSGIDICNKDVIESKFKEILNDGYITKNVKYNINKINQFYNVKINNTYYNRRHTINNTKTLHNIKDDFFCDLRFNTFIIHSKKDYLINKRIQLHKYLDMFQKDLNVNGYSFNRIFKRDKSSNDNFYCIITIECVIDRPDIDFKKYKNRFKRRILKTRKNIYNVISSSSNNIYINGNNIERIIEDFDELK